MQDPRQPGLLHTNAGAFAEVNPPPELDPWPPGGTCRAARPSGRLTIERPPEWTLANGNTGMSEPASITARSADPSGPTSGTSSRATSTHADSRRPCLRRGGVSPGHVTFALCVRIKSSDRGVRRLGYSATTSTSNVRTPDARHADT